MLFDHPHGRPCHEEAAREVDTHRRVPLIEGEFLKGAGDADAGVDHGSVEATEGAHGLADRVLHDRLIRLVTRHEHRGSAARFADACARLVQASTVKIGEDQRGATRGQLQRDAPADSRCRARDDRDEAREIGCGGSQRELVELHRPVVEAEGLSVVEPHRGADAVGDRGSDSMGVQGNVSGHLGVTERAARGHRAETGHEHDARHGVMHPEALGHRIGIPIDVGRVLRDVAVDVVSSGVRRGGHHGSRLDAQHVIGAAHARRDDLGEKWMVRRRTQACVDPQDAPACPRHGPAQAQEESLDLLFGHIWDVSRSIDAEGQGVKVGPGPIDGRLGALPALVARLTPGDEAMVGEDDAVAVAEIGDHLAERESGPHPVDVGESITERLSDDAGTLRVVGESADGVGVDMVDVRVWEKRVQQGLDRGTARTRVE